MISVQALRDRSLFLFAVGCVLLFPPLLLVADHAAFVIGIPVIYLYIFACWGGLIAAGAVLARRLAQVHDLPSDGRD